MNHYLWILSADSSNMFLHNILWAQISFLQNIDVCLWAMANYGGYK